jgi:uncharacterized membrane protein
MAFEKIKDAADKYTSGLDRGKKGVEQLGTLVKGVKQLKDALPGGGNGDGGGPIEGVKNVAKAVTGKGDQPKTVKTAHLIDEKIDVAVPRRSAYNQWTQFKQFKSIMKGVEGVEQKRPDRVTWSAKIGPSRRQWQTQITEHFPDERIAWKTTGGPETVGAVTFHSLDERLTRVQVQMEYHPKGFIEGFGNFFRIQRRRARRDLKLFKNYLELAGKESGAWRGTIRKKEDLKRDAKNEESSGRSGAGSRGSRSRPKSSSRSSRSNRRRSSSNGRQRKTA